MEIASNFLLSSLLHEVCEVATDVVKVSVGERRSFKRGVDVHEFSLGIPGTQSDSGFCCTRGTHDVFQLRKVWIEVDSCGLSIVNALGNGMSPTFGRIGVDGQSCRLDGHGHSQCVQLPGQWREHHQGCSPKLGGHVATNSPAQSAQDLPGAPNLPTRLTPTLRRGYESRLGLGVRQGVSFPLQKSSTNPSGWGPR